MDKGTENQLHTVVILLDERGNIDYENGLIRAIPGDTIVWQCPRCKEGRKPFSVHIGWNSPFPECSYQSPDGSDIAVDVPAEAQFGHYRYVVAALVNGNIYTDDPELIVRKPKKGG